MAEKQREGELGGKGSKIHVCRVSANRYTANMGRKVSCVHQNSRAVAKVAMAQLFVVCRPADTRQRLTGNFPRVLKKGVNLPPL
jgi:hypothetical protein